MLLLNEIFSSIQGEGCHTGVPATFVRLQGCSVGCIFCDTKESWSFKKGFLYSIDKILNEIDTNHVIITGGEPFEQDMSELISAIYHKYPDITIQIEASGTEFYHIDERVFLTISPKFLSKKPVLAESLDRANEIKLVITSSEDFLFLDKIPTKDKAISLQPEGNKPELLKLCYDYCLKHNIRLSVQMHKLLAIR